MDGDPDDLELLLNSAQQEIATLRGDRRLGELSGSRGAALRDHVLDLLNAVDYRLHQRPSDDASQAARQAFARSLRQSIVMLRGAHAALPWLAATRTPNINLGSLYATEECARILVGPEIDLVVVPDPEFMYSTTSWPFSAVIESTRGFTPTAARRPIVLNYPLSDSDRLLLHPLFAHELGHASVDEHGLIATVEAKLDGDALFAEGFHRAVTAMSKEWPAGTQTQIASTLRAWLRDWIEELMCDHLATEAMGPSFMWAFAGFVLPLSYGEPSPAYPPNTMRMRLILDHLKRRGWRDYLEDVAPKITAWLDRVAAETASAHPMPFSFLRDQLLAHESALQDAATGRIGEEALDPESSITEANQVSKLLDHLILPVGLEEPIEPRAILLGGWQHAIQTGADRPRGLVNALTDTRLQDLLGKAIEMSTVRSSWEANA